MSYIYTWRYGLEEFLPCGRFGEMLARLFLPKCMKVSASAKLDDQACESIRLEIRVKCRQKWVVERPQDVPLRVDTLDLLPSLQELLVHHLHSKPTLAMLTHLILIKIR